MTEQNIHAEFTNRLHAGEKILWHVFNGMGSIKSTYSTRVNNVIWVVSSLVFLLVLLRNPLSDSSLKSVLLGLCYAVIGLFINLTFLKYYGNINNKPAKEFRNCMITDQRVVVFDEHETLSFFSGSIRDIGLDYSNGAKVLALDIYGKRKNHTHIIIGNVNDHAKTLQLIRSLMNQGAT